MTLTKNEFYEWWLDTCAASSIYHFTDGVRDGRKRRRARSVLSLLFPFWLVSSCRMNEWMNGWMNQSNLHLQQKQALMVRRSLSLVTDDAFLFFDKNNRRNRTRQTHRSTSTSSTHEIDIKHRNLTRSWYNNSNWIECLITSTSSIHYVATLVTMRVVGAKNGCRDCFSSFLIMRFEDDIMVTTRGRPK